MLPSLFEKIRRLAAKYCWREKQLNGEKRREIPASGDSGSGVSADAVTKKTGVA